MRDKIWQFTRNISINQSSKELNHKMLGFFENIEKKKFVSVAAFAIQEDSQFLSINPLSKALR